MYASVEQLQRYLGQVPKSAADTAVLADCLTRATDAVRTALRAALADPTFDWAAYTTGTQIVRGYLTDTLALPAHQVGSVSLVEEQSTSSPIAYAAIADTWAEEADGRLYRPAGWSIARYRITAAWGYGATVPADAEAITLELAVNIWRSKDKGGFSETIGADGSASQRVVSGLSRDHRARLDALAQTLWQVHL